MFKSEEEGGEEGKKEYRTALSANGNLGVLLARVVAKDQVNSL